MDVARISMITPKQIDWRKLTAKDIIKYDAQGMEIPSQYLQWARAFHVDLEKNDTDETTYEMAVSKPATRTKNGLAKNQQTQNTPENVDNIDNSDNKEEEIDTQKTPETDNEGDKTGTEVKRTDKDQTTDKVTKDGKSQQTDENEENNTTENPLDNPNLTPHQKRKIMEEQGASLTQIGETFKTDSDTSSELSDSTNKNIENLGNTSDNAIESLDSYMSQLLSEVNDAQSKIENYSKKEITSTNIGKIKELKEQIISLGTDGQTTAMGYDSDLNEYQPQIETGLPIGQSGQAIGAETIDIGKEILSRYMFWRSALGFKDIAAGTTAANAGSKVQDTSTAISEKNTTNINAVKDHEQTIQDVTGVSTADIPQEKQDNKDKDKTQETTAQNATDNQMPKTATTETQDTKAEKELAQKEKDNENMSDDKKTDVEKKEEKIASGNLDELLKRKLRKGEVETNA